MSITFACDIASAVFIAYASIRFLKHLNSCGPRNTRIQHFIEWSSSDVPSAHRRNCAVLREYWAKQPPDEPICPASCDFWSDEAGVQIEYWYVPANKFGNLAKTTVVLQKRFDKYWRRKEKETGTPGLHLKAMVSTPKLDRFDLQRGLQKEVQRKKNGESVGDDVDAEEKARVEAEAKAKAKHDKQLSMWFSQIETLGNFKDSNPWAFDVFYEEKYRELQSKPERFRAGGPKDIIEKNS